MTEAELALMRLWFPPGDVPDELLLRHLTVRFDHGAGRLEVTYHEGGTRRVPRIHGVNEHVESHA